MSWRRKKEKIRDYSQLCYDLRRQNPTHRVVSHPLVIGATGRLNSIKKEIDSVMDDIKVTDSIMREMQKTVVVNTQQTIYRILTGLLQITRINEVYTQWYKSHSTVTN